MKTNNNEAACYKTTSFRAEAALVDDAREVFAAHDLSVSAAITLFLEACVRQGRIPEGILNPDKPSAGDESVDILLRSIADFLNLPDYGNQLIPSCDFANEIVLEFTDSIFLDCYEPWWKTAHHIIDMSTWESQQADDDSVFDECMDMVVDFIPKKLPYDYALEIVKTETKQWAKAGQDADQETEKPYDAIMGHILKRSHLTLDMLMELLVEAGAVDNKNGDTFNHSIGKMTENLVVFLKKNGHWGIPEDKNGVPFKEVEEGLMDKVIDKNVAYRVNSDCTRYLSMEHPISLMFEDIACSMNLAIEDSYNVLFDEFYYEIYDMPLSIYDSCDFRFPPKAAYDEAEKRYLKAMEEAEPGTIAAKCLPYVKKPYDLSDMYLYSVAIDMDIDLWAEIYNREAFFTIVQAVESGKLPKPKRRIQE